MNNDHNSWVREASLLRPAVLTEAIFADGATPDRSRPWVPEALLPLYGGESLARLSDAQRLRYNDIYARFLLAQIIWIERHIIRAPLRKLLGEAHPDANTSEILHSFISDETNHIECLSRLSALAAANEPPPAGVTLPLFQPPMLVRILAATASRFPARLSFWILVTTPFEQLTISIAQNYMRDREVDPLFRDVFIAHARDEARHCRLDDLFSTWLRSAASDSWNRFNDRLLFIFQTAYHSHGWGFDRPIRELAHAHPEIADKVDAMMAEIKTLRREMVPPTEFVD